VFGPHRVRSVATSRRSWRPVPGCAERVLMSGGAARDSEIASARVDGSRAPGTSRPARTARRSPPRGWSVAASTASRRTDPTRKWPKTLPPDWTLPAAGAPSYAEARPHDRRHSPGGSELGKVIIRNQVTTNGAFDTPSPQGWRGWQPPGPTSSRTRRSVTTRRGSTACPSTSPREPSMVSWTGTPPHRG
jgi:hypothetical protein